MLSNIDGAKPRIREALADSLVTELRKIIDDNSKLSVRIGPRLHSKTFVWSYAGPLLLQICRGQSYWVLNEDCQAAESISSKF